MKCKYCDSQLIDQRDYSYCNNPECICNMGRYTERDRRDGGRIDQAIHNIAYLNSRREYYA